MRQPFRAGRTTSATCWSTSGVCAARTSMVPAASAATAECSCSTPRSSGFKGPGIAAGNMPCKSLSIGLSGVVETSLGIAAAARSEGLRLTWPLQQHPTRPDQQNICGAGLSPLNSPMPQSHSAQEAALHQYCVCPPLSVSCLHITTIIFPACNAMLGNSTCDHLLPSAVRLYTAQLDNLLMFTKF